MVVVDAGVVVALFVPDPRREAVHALFRSWVANADERHAPAVMLYEVMNVLSRQRWDGAMTAAETDAVWADIPRLGIAIHPFDPAADGPRSLEIAAALNRRHATDCAYVSLAERLGTQVWTLDASFARAAAGARLPVTQVT